MELKTWELIDFLKELYQDTSESDKEAEIHVLDLKLEGLWESLSKRWGFLDKSALDIDHVAEDYNNRKNKWKNIVEDAKKLTDIEFVIKHGDSYLKELQDAEELDERTIRFEKDHILRSPFPIALELDEKFLEWDGQKIYSFKIHEVYPLRVNLHIKHEKRLFHEILYFFSLSIEKPKGQEFTMNFINSYYSSMIISYEIISYLESENYRKSSARIEKYTNYNSKYCDMYLELDYSKSIPFFLKVYFIDLFSDSIKSLLSSLSSHLENIQEIIDNFRNVSQPSNYYSIYEEEVKQFIEQGKRLFLKNEDLIYKTRAKERKTDFKKEKKASLSEEILLGLFQLEYDRDIKMNIDISDAGFRSLPEIFKKNKVRLEMSWKTFNDKALNIIERSPRIKTRDRKKTGGGKEYRVKVTEPEMIDKSLTPSIILEEISGEKHEILMEYEQAKILHDDGKVKMAVDMFESIIGSYETPIEAYSYIYCDICYRLGQIYELNGYLANAERVYKAGDQNKALSSQQSYSFEIALYKVELLRGNYQNLVEKLSKLEKKIQNRLSHDFEILNREYKYIEDTNIEDLDIVYIRDLKRDLDYSKNPVFQEVIQLDLDLLNLRVLRLDILRRQYYKNSLENMEIDVHADEIYFNQEISENMKMILDQAENILKEVNLNNFNFGNKAFILIELYKTYFENGRLMDRWFDYGIPDTYFPDYYTKFLFDMTNYTALTDRIIFERLNRFEFISLDPESQVEYLIKFCVSNWRVHGSGIRGYNLINKYKNMKTLIDHANFLVEKFELVHFRKIVKQVQSWMEKIVKDFIESYSEIAERLRKREVRKK